MLNKDDLCLRVTVLSSKTIPGTNIRRLKLKLFEGSSPTRRSTEKDNADGRRHALQGDVKAGEKAGGATSVSTEEPCSSITGKNFSITNKDILNLNPESKQFDEYSDANNNDSEDNFDHDVNYEGKTPLERYVLITETQITDKGALIAKLKQKKRYCKRINRVKTGPSNGNICRNCHFRLGHRARKCTMRQCTSVFKCGEEKYHVGETKIRELRSQIRKHEMELKKLMTELENKQSAINASKNSVSSKIESELFRFKKTDYILNGNKNWSLLRKLVYAIEQYCKQHFGGRLPARHDIFKILANALADNYSSLSYHRSKESLQRKCENPFKSQPQSVGVQFPAPDESLSSPPREKTFSPILVTAPTNSK